MRKVIGNLILTCTVIACTFAGQANAGTISINFSGGTKTLDASTNAGVVNVNNWNNINNGNGTSGNLVDNSGTSTSATVTYSSAGIWDGATAPNTSSPGTNTVYQGALYGLNGTEVSATVNTIPYGTYDVYVYWGAGFNAVHTMGLTTPVGSFYSVANTGNAANATSLTQFTSTDSANPTKGDAGYTEFRWTGSSFTVSTTGSDTVSNQIYGIQIDAVPEPSTFALLGLGVLGLAIKRLRKRN